jgi:serine/threonine protein kinase
MFNLSMSGAVRVNQELSGEKVLPEGVFSSFVVSEVLAKFGEQTFCRATYDGDGSPWLLLLLAPGSFREAEHRARFISSVKSVSSVDHEGFLTLAGVEEDSEWVMLAYRDQPGLSLHQMLQNENQFNPVRAVSIVGQAAEAMAAAHEAGVLHRDLNPGWILVFEPSEEEKERDERDAEATAGGEDGVPKKDRSLEVRIAGLGVIPLLYETDSEFLSSLNQRSAGLRAYLAPEQMVPSEPSDQRADIYSLGAVAYRLLVGKPPGGFVVLPSLRAEVNKFTDDVVMKALHTDREKRCSSAVKFSADLRKIGGGNRNDPFAALLVDSQRKKRNLSSVKKPSKVLLVIAFLGLFSVVGAGSYGVYRYFFGNEEVLAAATPRLPEGSEGKADMPERHPTDLQKARDFISKGDNKAALKIILATVSSSVNGEGEEVDFEAMEEAIMMAVEAGDGDTALKLAKIYQESIHEDAADRKRVDALIKRLEVGREGYEKSMAKAKAARKSGDEAGERMELARAAGYLEGHPSTAAAAQACGYDPEAMLSAALAKIPEGMPAYEFFVSGAEMHVDLSGNKDFKSLYVLQGMPITHLDVCNTAVSSLAPLVGMPLQEFRAEGTKVMDVSALEGAPLRVLTVEGEATVSGYDALGENDFFRIVRIGAGDDMVTVLESPRAGKNWVNSLGMRVETLPPDGRMLMSAWETRVIDFVRFAQATDYKAATNSPK